MAQQYPPNTMFPETRAASDAYRAKSSAIEIKLKQKYVEVGSSKNSRTKTSGNSGHAGRAWRRGQRGYGGGQPTIEEKARREQQSLSFSAWRASGWTGPQPG